MTPVRFYYSIKCH